MAINRFMQPWKRDFSQNNYVPNFDAWAQVVAQKDKNYQDVLANADKISTLIPETGFALQEDRSKYLEEVKSKASNIIDGLHETSNVNDARRSISHLANEVSMDPRLSVYKNDASLKENAAKAMLSQTSNTDVYANDWFDPKSGKVKQTSWEQWNPAHYGTVETKDTDKMFKELVEPIAPIFEQLKKEGLEDIKVVQVENDDGTVTNRYFTTTTGTTKEYKDLEHFKNYLFPGGDHFQYAEQTFRNRQGQDRAYWDAKYKGMTEEEREAQWFTDLIGAASVYIMDKTTTTESVQEMKGGGSTKNSHNNKPNDISIASAEEPLPVQLDKLNTNVGSLMSTHRKERKEMSKLGTAEGIGPNNIDMSKLNISLHNILKDQGYEELNEDFYIKSPDGTFILNPIYPFTDMEKKNTVLRPINHLGITPEDQVHKLNNEIRSRQHQHDIREIVLRDHLGISLEDEAKLVKLITPEIKEKAFKRLVGTAYDYGEDMVRYGEDIASRAEGGKYITEYIKKNEELRLQYQDEELVKALEKSESVNDKALAQKFKEANEYLKKSANEINQVNSNVYYPFAMTTGGKTELQGVSAVIGQWVKAGQNTMRMNDQLIVDPDKRKIIADALNSKFTNPEGKTDYDKDFSIDTVIFFDPEESKYKFRVDLNNAAVATNLGVKSGAAYIEMDIPKNARIGNKTVSEFLGLEGNPELVSMLEQVEKQFAKNGIYVASFQDGDHSAVISLDVLDPKRDKSVMEASVNFRFDGNTSFKLKTPSTREGSLLKLLVDDLKNLPPGEASENFAVQAILSYSNTSQETALQLARTAIGANILTMDSNYNDPFFSISENAKEGVILNRQSMQLLHKLGRKIQEHSPDTKMHLTNGYRDEETNANTTGSSKDSLHLSGLAFDASIKDESGKVNTNFIKALEKIVGGTIEKNKMYNIPGYNLRVMRHVGTADHFHFEIIE